MNISAHSSSVSSITTPLKAERVASPKSTVSPQTETVIQQPANDAVASSHAHAPPPPVKATQSTSSDIETQQPGHQKTSGSHDAAPDSKAVTGQATDAKIPHSDGRKESAFSEAELDVIRALKSRDVEISAHEQAHTSVGGRHASSPVYRYKTGPDGVKYAISGEVAIDTSKIPGDPQATLQKAQQIKAAALAPVDPSAQDIQVVAKAEQMAAQARSEIVEANSHNNEDGHSSASATAETKIPEHFTETAHLSHVNNLDSHTEKLMSARNVHINRFYQNSARVTPLSSFNVQV